ncbi:Protein disulfide-isomerase [Monocercomonoides exilis]|uniref:Protein disulfide-isomerase n=1 Tax=Monocercomonoides exilis TaxID=2049356 RepID=UPI00355A2E4D|nr:Protein disulfide-isomerase [Monocercomonoides exilis]|eukprot:MONOS_14044.1-p1 / transcript=MONOS_14044.1 / gene=MONOS_14044 / organism=Monocercomonoides_exilis_PA203 / gene_product=Protein disulfide-isomerase / transcript_product=Protein disulfide-isomerase / location=Mono_scaffold00927:9464-10271(-) / protein_length=187 / sequence_SO=supercontig / SO=protein_coding / is_pseudo=false
MASFMLRGAFLIGSLITSMVGFFAYGIKRLPTRQMSLPGENGEFTSPDLSKPNTPSPSSTLIGQTIVKEKLIDDQPYYNLTDDQLRMIQKTKELWMVLFYSHKCGWCKMFMPTYEEFGLKMQNDPILHVAAVDCIEQNKICNYFKINGYPTVKLFYGEKAEEFEKDRTVENLVDFVDEMEILWGLK